ncbi:hypothetical protein GCM10011611_20650 [Aliidongia dinghuensis]|uniref:Uncharacterized protein n=1 Tax=Aliidongia dinghuensis TaxID=1867774 RepID=A0A8J2YSA6_9PROT|nr:hypothetical protein GCM10011611_20650 [Aliidongia dinghuensis]
MNEANWAKNEGMSVSWSAAILRFSSLRRCEIDKTTSRTPAHPCHHVAGAGDRDGWRGRIGREKGAWELAQPT